MTIKELLAAAGLTANDEIPIWDAEASGEPTKKVTAANLAASVKTLASLIGAADLPLTVAQGGTGAANAAAARTNLGITPANIRAVATSNIANNLTTTAAGKVLDARQGKYIMDNPDQLIFAEVEALKSAGYRNSIGRGKNLGTFTGMMSDDIKAGDFSGFGIGDTFKYGNRTHTIAHFDPFYRCGDTISLGHHIAVVSDGGWSSRWNTSNTTAGGYVGSAIRAYIKSSGGPQEQIIGDFGSGHVLSYRQLYPTTYDSIGKATGWAWTDAMSELINEVLTYGCPVWAVNAFEVGIEKFQLALFRLFPELLNIRAYWWLRSVTSAIGAAIVGADGSTSSGEVSSTLSVRPLSLIV